MIVVSETEDFTKNKDKEKIAEKMGALLTKKGAKAYVKAKEILLNEKFECETIREAILFFIQEWREVKHPGLLSIACESVGGDPESVNDIGAALLLLLSSAHIHDDIMDHSRTREGKLTVYGKFGEDIALLVGDALLFEGLMLLHQFCERLPAHKKEAVLNLTKSAFFEVGAGEADEVALRMKDFLSAEECLENLKRRAAVAEAVMRIGAVIGCGSSEETEILGQYGRNLGILTAIREEFIDVFEPEELMNRYRCKCLPLPILYALQNEKKREEIIRLISKKRIREEDAYMLADLIIDTEEIEKLKKNMQSLIENTIKLITPIRRNKKALRLLLYSTMEDL